MSIATIYKGIYTNLAADGPVNTQTGGAIYAGLLEQEHDFSSSDAVVFNQVDSVPDPDNSDVEGVTRSRFEVSSYADSYADAVDLSAKVDAVLIGSNGAFGDASVANVLRASGPQDIVEQDGERRVFRRLQDYTFLHVE